MFSFPFNFLVFLLYSTQVSSPANYLHERNLCSDTTRRPAVARAPFS